MIYIFAIRSTLKKYYSNYEKNIYIFGEGKIMYNNQEK